MPLDITDQIQKANQLLIGLRDILEYLESCNVKDLSVSVYVVYEKIIEDVISILQGIEEWRGENEKNGINSKSC